MKIIIDNIINEWNDLPGFRIIHISVHNTGYLLDIRIVVLGIGADILLCYKKFEGAEE